MGQRPTGQRANRRATSRQPGTVAAAVAGELAHESPLVGLTVIGQRGIASWEPGDLPPTPTTMPAAELSARGRDLLEAISNCLATGEASRLGAARPAAGRPQTLEIAAAAEPPTRVPLPSARGHWACCSSVAARRIKRCMLRLLPPIRVAD